MKISVIIPIYNNARYIKQCIESINRQKENVEIILIDDCSNDDLEVVLEKLKKENVINKDNFIYIRNKKNIGTAKSRNIGILQATGEYVAFLDSDDWWEPLKISKQIDLINKTGGVLLYTARRNIFEAENKSKVLQVNEIVTYEELLKNNQISCSSVLLKTEVAKKYLMKYDGIHEDYYMWLRILKDYGIAYGINEPLLNYRVHNKSKSNNKLKSAIMTLKTIRLMKEPFYKICVCFIHYAIAGIKKYRK